MGLFDGLIQKIRDGADDVGSFITGQPAHGPSIQSAPIQQTPQQPNLILGNPSQNISGPSPFQQQLNNINGVQNNTPSVAQPSLPPASILHDLTHNPITNLGGSIIKPIIQTGEAVNQGIGNAELAIAGRPTENQQQFQQNLPSGVNKAINTGYQGTTKQNLGNLAQTGLTALSGPIEGLAKSGATLATGLIAPEATQAAITAGRIGLTAAKSPFVDNAIKYGGNALAGGVINSGFGAAQTAGQGGTTKDVLSSVPASFAQGAALAVGGTALGAVAPPVLDAIKQGGQKASDALHSLPDQQRTNVLKSATQNTSVQNMPIKNLTSYEGAPDKARVDMYKQQIQSGQPVDPLIAMQDNSGNLGVEDGKHRLQAYKELGYDSVPTQITTPEQLTSVVNDSSKSDAVNPNIAKATVSDYGLSHDQSSTLLSSDLNDSSTKSTPSKGFIIKEGPLVGGKRDVIRVKVDPKTGNLIKSHESINTRDQATFSDSFAPEIYNGSRRQSSEERKVAEQIPDAKIGSPNLDTSPKPLLQDDSLLNRSTKRDPWQELVQQDTRSRNAKAEVNNMSQDEINKARERGVQDVNALPLAGRGNMMDLTDREAKHTILSAKNTAEGEVMNVVARHQILDRAIRNGVHGTDESHMFFDALEHPEMIDEYASNVEDPEGFKNAVKEQKDFNKYALLRNRDTGTPLNEVQNYLHHNVDLSDPEKQAKFNELADSAGKLGQPGYTRQRVFNDLRDMESHGFNLKYPDARDAARDYANQVGQTLSRNTFVNKIAEEAPGHIQTVETNDGRVPVDNQGKSFATGRTNGLNKTYMSPQIIKQLNKYIEPHELPTGFKTLDKFNQAIKQTKLAGGGFHDLNMTKRYITQEIASGLTGEPKRLLNVVTKSIGQDHAFWSQGAFDNKLSQFRDSGLLDRVTRNGGNLTLGKNLDIGQLDKDTNVTSVEKSKTVVKGIASIPHRLNEALHAPLFARKIPLLKLQTAESEIKRANIPLEGDLTMEQQAKVHAITTQINNLYGGINEGAIAKTVLGKQIERYALLAPDFTGGNINSVTAMFKGGAKGLAWRQNLGNLLSTVILAGVATGAVALSQGQDGKKALEQKIKDIVNPHSPGFLKPSVTLPFKVKGERLTASMPGSPIEEALKLKNPVSFFQGRLSGLTSAGLSYATNKNYYGDSLVDPSVNPHPTRAQMLGELAKSNVPIPAVQGFAVQGGKNNIVTAILNTAGFKVGKDPTDPKVIANNNYFNLLKQTTQNLTTNDASAWGVVHPVTKDRNGQYVISPTVFDTTDKAATYLAHPNVLVADTQLNQALLKTGQKVDPFFNLSPDKQKAYLESQLIDKNNTGQETIWKQNNPWAAQFQQDRAAFYNSLPPGDPNKPKVPIQPPIETSNVQTLFAQENMLTDPKDKSLFYAAHPELTQYEQQYADYTNKVLTAQGLTPLKPVPQADPDTASYMATYMAADKATRTAMRTGNPQGYKNMSGFLQNMSEYQVAKNGALDQFQGQTPNQKLLKGIDSLATYDMVKNPDGTLALKYGSVNPGDTTYGSVAGTPEPGATATGPGSSGFSKKSASHSFRIARIKTPKFHKTRRAFARNPKKAYVNSFVKQYDTPNFGQEASRGKIKGLKAPTKGMIKLA